MFPAGRPGIGLLLLRICVAVLPFTGGSTRFVDLAPRWLFPIIILPVFLICLGFLTTILSGVSCLLALAGLLIFRFGDAPLILLTVLNLAAIAMLGPGAYSLDALLFGRRVIVVSPDDSGEDR